MFLDKVSLSVDEGYEWVVDRLSRYLSKYGVIRIYAGFKTDLASIPRIARIAIPVNGKHRKSSVLHDLLYRKKGLIEFFPLKDSITGDSRSSYVKALTRKECDQMFLEAMKKDGVGWFVRSAMYSAVRTGGWVFWNRVYKA